MLCPPPPATLCTSRRKRGGVGCLLKGFGSGHQGQREGEKSGCRGVLPGCRARWCPGSGASWSSTHGGLSVGRLSCSTWYVPGRAREGCSADVCGKASSGLVQGGPGRQRAGPSCPRCSRHLSSLGLLQAYPDCPGRTACVKGLRVGGDGARGTPATCSEPCSRTETSSVLGSASCRAWLQNRPYLGLGPLGRKQT